MTCTNLAQKISELVELDGERGVLVLRLIHRLADLACSIRVLRKKYLPISVLSPVPITIPTAFPDATFVP